MITKNNSVGLLALITVLAFAAAPAFAASDIWTGSTNGDFSNTGNWLGGSVPGDNSGTNQLADTATFNNAVNTTITVDANRTLQGFIFDTGAGGFAFSGGQLFGTGNVVLINSTTLTASQTFNTAISGLTHNTAANRNIAFRGVAAGASGVLLNLNGDLSAGINVTGAAAGGTITFSNYIKAMVRGVIQNPGPSATTSVSFGDHLNKMVWLKGEKTYTGSTGFNRSMLIFDSITPMGGGASSLGNATATTGNIAVGQHSGLYYVGRDSAGHTTDRVINYSYVYGSTPLLSANGVGPLVLAGDMYTNSNQLDVLNYNNVRLGGTSAQENVFSGVVADSVYTGVNVPSLTRLSKVGEGTWNVAGANTYTQETILRAGTLRLDFAAATAPTDNIVNSFSPLFLYDGVLAVRGKDGTVHTQTFNGTSLREGYSSIEVAPGANGTVTVNLGALGRASSFGASGTGSVLNVSNPSGAMVATTHGDTTNNVLTINATAFATANKTDWATLMSGTIVALGSYQTSTDPTAWGASDNVSLSGNPDSNPGTQTINTLRLTGSSAITLDGNLKIDAGGILISGTGANSFTGGNLIGGGNQTNRELIVVQNNTAQSAAISSRIIGEAGTTLHLTKAGPGTLFLTENMSGVANRWSETTIADGVLAVPFRNALGASTTKFAGGQVGLTQDDMIAEVSSGVTGTLRFQIIGSWGFAAYGGTRTVDLRSNVNMEPLVGELLLGAPDSDGKIILTSTTSNQLQLFGGYTGLLAAVRVFDGDADVDAEIGMAITSGNNNNQGGIIKVGAGVLELSGTNTYNGPTIVAEGGLIVTGSNPNSMLTEVRSGAWLGGNGTVSSIEIHSGAKLAPGMSIGTLSTQNNGNGYFLWNGEADDTPAGQLQFELSSVDNTSDQLNLGTSEFLKGDGSVFKFDFLGGTGKVGEVYTLVSFGTTTFSDGSDFTFDNLGGDNTGSFTLNSNSLTFSVIPEPGTIGMLAAGLALALLRRRLHG